MGADPRSLSDRLEPCPECKGEKRMDYGMADAWCNAVLEQCGTCKGSGVVARPEPRRYLALLQDERGYGKPLEPAPPEGPSQPVLFTVVKADDHEAEVERLRAENEALRGILDGEDIAAIERAGHALHDREPWVYGQDADGADITRPWNESADAVRESYLTDALVALRAAGETRVATDEESNDG